MTIRGRTLRAVLLLLLLIILFLILLFILLLLFAGLPRKMPVAARLL